MGGEAGDGGVGRDVADDGGTGGYSSPLPYLDAWDDSRTSSYPGTFADVDVTAEGCVGGDVDVVSDFTFVVDGGASVDDTMSTDIYIGLDYRTFLQDCTFFDICIFRNDGGRMDRSGVHQRISVRYHFPYPVRSYTYYQWTFDRPFRGLENRNPMDVFTVGRIIIKASNIITISLDYILDYL